MDAVPIVPPLFRAPKNTTLHELQTGDRSRATDRFIRAGCSLPARSLYWSSGRVFDAPNIGVDERAEGLMPLLRYLGYVGGVLLMLILVADAYLPKLPAAQTSGPRLPVIHIYADRKGPERVVYDTSVPMNSPAPAVSADAGVPAQAAVVDVSSRVREAFGQLQPSDAGTVQSADPKKPEPKQPPRKAAKRHPHPPVRMVDQQLQFGWFGPQRRFW